MAELPFAFLSVSGADIETGEIDRKDMRYSGDMLIFEFTPDSDMKVRIFESYDEEWLDFVCSCRKGNDVYKEYDIIEGEVAKSHRQMSKVR